MSDNGIANHCLGSGLWAELTPLELRVVAALEGAPGHRLSYYALAGVLWPPEQCPKAWRHSTHGGPPGWSRPLGRALRELREADIAYEKRPRGGGSGRGDVVLLKTR